MANLQNHKGSFCNYKSIFCQEGYCAGCEIGSFKQVSAKFVTSIFQKKISLPQNSTIIAFYPRDPHLCAMLCHVVL